MCYDYGSNQDFILEILKKQSIFSEIHMKDILIYAGAGANSFCINLLISALKHEKLNQTHISTVTDHRFFLETEWQKKTQLVIFPGGRDVPYHRALKGPANRQISDFVHQGGSFLGVCAGGYYGSAFVEFEKGSPLEVLQDRELQFFPGIARGPAYGLGKFQYQREEDARIAHLNLFSSPSSLSCPSFSYYNGGCTFVKAEEYENVSILAQYSDIKGTPAAIVKCCVGKGTAILCGVHPEYSAHYFDAKNSLEKDFFLTLQKIESQRRVLFQTILNLLDLPTDSKKI
jgi:biotin--protein ligase